MLLAKAFHLIFMVTWFSGLFYLPRLFVYHAEAQDEISNARFKIMERKLYFGITTPGAILTIIFGLWVLHYNFLGYMHTGWMDVKLILVFFLLIYHFYLGKIIGGGMPVGAFGGRKEIMECIAPLGPVYQAGTLSGNPIAMTAGLASLELISTPNFYEQLAKKTAVLCNGLTERAQKIGLPFLVNSVCGMFGFYFTDQHEIKTLTQVKKSNVSQFQKFFHGMLKEGVYFAPSAFEAGFISTAHTDEDISKTLHAAEKIMALLPLK